MTPFVCQQGSKAAVSKAVRMIKCQCRFALSGTPVQNVLEELWNILDWYEAFITSFYHAGAEWCDWIVLRQETRGPRY